MDIKSINNGDTIPSGVIEASGASEASEAIEAARINGCNEHVKDTITPGISIFFDTIDTVKNNIAL